MPLIATLVSVLVIGPQQSAPPDVLKNHWAYPAVDRMFLEGLLKGYPSRQQPKLTLDKSIKQDFKKAEQWYIRWKRLKLFVEHHEFMGYRGRSNYEYAVAAHAVYANIKASAEGDYSSTTLAIGRKELPDLARAISMFSPELKQLGVNPAEMIAHLNDIESSKDRLFLGNRR